ncbi:MAG: threonine synthase [Firmicutes bacterium]|nr:threonine synthase [Bacillota bacterium]
MWQGLINRYKQFLPINAKTPIITLNEGNTPLLKADNLCRRLGLNVDLYLKYEGQNPTGSFKDRGMTVAVSKALEAGSEAVICASTGNTSASAAAYAAKAKIRCLVLIPEKAVALGKLAQAITYGAEVLALKGNFDVALELVKQVADEYPLTLVNSLNPHRIEGQQTAAFEICEQLGSSPDYLCIPVGNAGNITAYWQGFQTYYQNKLISKLPILCGFQAEGAAPIVLGQAVTEPETIATAIRIGNPASWKQAEQARDESGGLIAAVSDQEILDAYALLAREEGVFAEPGSAASMAGVIKLARRNYFPAGSKVVCVLTGHGLKDPDTAVSVGKSPRVLTAELKSLLSVIDG